MSLYAVEHLRDRPLLADFQPALVKSIVNPLLKEVSRDQPTARVDEHLDLLGKEGAAAATDARTGGLGKVSQSGVRCVDGLGELSVAKGLLADLGQLVNVGLNNGTIFRFDKNEGQTQ